MVTIKFLSSLAYDITKEPIELEINKLINLKQILSELSVKYPKINEKIIMDNEINQKLSNNHVSLIIQKLVQIDQNLIKYFSFRWNKN